jgi:hypothetical protein
MASDLSAAPVVLAREAFDTLLAALRRRGFSTIGPVRRDHAIHYDEIAAATDLPIGWTDRQQAGRYRLERHETPTLFGYTAGAASWKRVLHPPVRTLWRIRRTPAGTVLDPQAEPPPRQALVGVRACEVAAIRILDRVLRDGVHPRRRLRRAARRVVHRGGQLRPRRRYVLLHVHGHRSALRGRRRSRADRARDRRSPSLPRRGDERGRGQGRRGTAGDAGR